ncbi:MAG: hypothetical protein ACKPHU_35735, partial [Planctomycetaceae bacterium]
TQKPLASSTDQTLFITLQMRERMRPVLGQTLRDVGLIPRNIPEQVALDKLVDDALDCIVSRGYLTLGYLRDSISRNDLKLPDLTDMLDLWQGDYLLRADDRLALSMDGVYQRGEFYLRWLQTTSSIFFGNRAGRFATLFLLIPFGGALVIVEGVRHLAHLFHRKPAAGVKSEAGESLPSETLPSETLPGETLPGELSGTGESAAELSTAESAAATEPAAAELGSKSESRLGLKSGSGRSEVQLTESAEVEGAGVPAVLVPAVSVPSVQQGPDTASWVLGVGFLLMALIHLSQFRRRFFRLLRSAVRLLKLALIEYPLRVARLPAVQAIWRHRAVVRFRRVVVVPAIVAWPLFRGIPGLFLGRSPGWLWYLSGCVLCSLALNSRPGQDAQELTS